MITIPLPWISPFCRDMVLGMVLCFYCYFIVGTRHALSLQNPDDIIRMTISELQYPDDNIQIAISSSSIYTKRTRPVNNSCIIPCFICWALPNCFSKASSSVSISDKMVAIRSCSERDGNENSNSKRSLV